MTLRGMRCFVRPWRLADVDALVRHANNVAVAKQLRDRFPHPYGRANATAFLKFATQDSDPANLAIEVHGEAVGGIGFVAGSDVERFSASTRVLEKAGYVREGILRASAVKFGQPRDQAIYSRINPNWRMP